MQIYSERCVAHDQSMLKLILLKEAVANEEDPQWSRCLISAPHRRGSMLEQGKSMRREEWQRGTLTD